MELLWDWKQEDYNIKLTDKDVIYNVLSAKEQPFVLTILGLKLLEGRNKMCNEKNLNKWIFWHRSSTGKMKEKCFEIDEKYSQQYETIIEKIPLGHIGGLVKIGKILKTNQEPNIVEQLPILKQYKYAYKIIGVMEIDFPVKCKANQHIISISDGKVIAELKNRKYKLIYCE